MTIANPIYDIVFKYLMEDLDIAKGILAAILNMEITELALQPQETIAETDHDGRAIRVYRIDFSAVVRHRDGPVRKILIELQKSRRNTTVLRFRRYLAENYQKEDAVVVNGVEKKQSLEIVTIYFLGFNLEHVPAPVLHVDHTFKDANTGKVVEEAAREEFVRLLNHESYMIQMRKLPKEAKSRLYQVLSVFNQSYRSSDDQVLEYKAEVEDPLVEKMLNRLTRAIADEDMRRKMNVEDEIERDYQEYLSLIERNKQEIERNKQVIEQKDQVIEQKDQELEQNKQELEQNKQELERKEREIAELKRLLESKK